jgi:hypothetical protein
LRRLRTAAGATQQGVIAMPKTAQFPLDMPAARLLATAGIVADARQIPPHLRLYTQQADQVMAKARDMVAAGQLDAQRAGQLPALLVEAADRILCHPIVADNRYLRRFAQGVTFQQARHELQQFSVFAVQFNVAQAQLVANAPTLDAYRERLHVLLNEEGIPYRDGFEGELTGQWSLDTVHFTWLRNMARGLDLDFEDLGKIWIALPGTKAFVDATFRYYASTDQNTAQGASFGIENWAANSLWEPWIAGMRKLNATLPRPVDLGYLTYHDAEEKHHSQATLDELFENFVEPWFDADKFLEGGERILTEGVQAYYQSQLDHLPDRDDTWPQQACGARR